MNKAQKMARMSSSLRREQLTWRPAAASNNVDMHCFMPGSDFSIIFFKNQFADIVMTSSLLAEKKI
uniref:Uncharacterized protein n=1 Tax=Arion vulgaris TaxID=1028688 RepID=A0A0B7B462_9EUPU